MQPETSKYIFLNKAIGRDNWDGVPVLVSGETVRYLGYEVRLGNLHKNNWAKGVRRFRRRMVTAKRAATTVRDRVDHFNAIMLPSMYLPQKCFHQRLQLSSN